MSPDELGVVISDLELESQGARICMTVDPYEVSSFCFPLGTDDRRQSVEFNQLADDQTALYDVFYARDFTPFLLKEYGVEMEAEVDRITRTIDEAYDKTRLVDHLIHQAPSIGNIGDREITLEQIERHFNVALAVVMGIYRIGVERLLEVYTSLLRSALDPNVDAVLTRTGERYLPSDLVDQIFEMAMRAAEHGRWYSKERLVSKRYSFYRDALAIDRLLFLNSELQRAHDRRDGPRVIILYFSSALRTKFIFSLPEVIERLPLVGGSAYPIHRSRAHAFAYVIHKARGSTRNEVVTDTLRNLREAAELLDLSRLIQLRRKFSTTLATDCAKCVLEGGSPDSPVHCSWFDVCEKVHGLEATIRQHRTGMQNLGLMSRIADYSRLLAVTPQKVTHEEYVGFFRRVFQQSAIEQELGDQALRKMRQLGRLIAIKRQFKDFLSPGLLRRDAAPFLRSGRDAVTNVAQYLPCLPRLLGQRYADILALVLDYFRLPVAFQGDRTELLDKAYRMYLDVDLKITELNRSEERRVG